MKKKNEIAKNILAAEFECCHMSVDAISPHKLQ